MPPANTSVSIPPNAAANEPINPFKRGGTLEQGELDARRASVNSQNAWVRRFHGRFASVITTCPLRLNLAVAEQACAGMSLGQWRRRARLAEVGCPVPVPDLRHVFEVLPNVVVVFVELPVERVDYV
jgi:hypothetical protein